MHRHLEPVRSSTVIDSSDYRAMQSMLESKARDLARLQRQVEDLKNSLESLQPGLHPLPHHQYPPPQRVDRSDAAAASDRPRAVQPPQDKSCGRELPRRITVSLNDYIHQRLIERSQAEGRSVSNLAAFILESHLDPD